MAMLSHFECVYLWTADSALKQDIGFDVEQL